MSTEPAPDTPTSPIEDISIDDHDPGGPEEPDTNPHWLWACVGNGGVPGQRVWVRYYAEAAPLDVPVYAATPWGPSVRIVTDGSVPNESADSATMQAASELLNAAAKAAHAANENGVVTQPKPARPAPLGMSAWVTTEDVQRALQVSKSKAHEYLRAAAGRSVGTGEVLRVPVDVWEEWARNNLINERRRKWGSEGQNQRRDTSTSGRKGASGGAGSTTSMAPSAGSPPGRPTKRRLGPGSLNGSVRPLIPTLTKPKP